MLKWLICLNAIWRKTILVVWKNDKIIRTHIFLGVSATGLVLKHELGRVSGHDGDGGGGVEYRRSVSEVPWFWWQVWSLAQQLTISLSLKKMKVSSSINCSPICSTSIIHRKNTTILSLFIQISTKYPSSAKIESGSVLVSLHKIRPTVATKSLKICYWSFLLVMK